MSRENVEVVRTGCEAWARGDLDAAAQIWDPDVEWAQVWTLRDGLALRIDNYTDRDEALEAAGLRQ
jgi:ketosteroid isomerase-like protein